MGKPTDVDNALFEGLFCNALDVTGPLEAELSRLGYDRRRPQPSYAGGVFLACLDATRQHTQSTLSEPEGFRELGRRLVGGFRETILGRVATSALPLLGPAGFLKRLPGRLAAVRHDASLEVTVNSSGSATLTFTDPLPLGPFFAGVVEAALRLARVPEPRVEVTEKPAGYVLTLGF